MDYSDIKTTSDRVIAEVGKAIIGKDDKIRLLLCALFSGGHVLIEDLPGTGKTMLAKSLAKTLSGSFKRVQFTPDLMPSDITGLKIFDRREDDFRLVKGPVFTNILLADEINRATPRTQSALLEAMEERQVSIDGETHELNLPFLVIATENPVETTGTYPLPEAQLDRFSLKLSLGQAEKKEELLIIESYMEEQPLVSLQAVTNTEELKKIAKHVKKVHVGAAVREYIVNLARATREEGRIEVGVSTRGVLHMVRLSQCLAATHGRAFVTPDDVAELLIPVWAHRLSCFGSIGKEAELLTEVAGRVRVPVEDWEK